jgi:AcrR family transcriptional regulator
MTHVISSSVRSPELVAARRRQIAAESYRIFREKGFKSATVEEVAVALGIDKATLYGYIERKEDLLYLVFQHYIPPTTLRLEEVARSVPVAKDRIAALLEEQICIVKDDPGLVLLTYRELRHLHHDAINSVLDMIRANHAPFQTAIAEAVAAGTIRPVDPTIVTHALLSMAYMLAPQAWDLGRFDANKLKAEITRLFFDGVSLGKTEVRKRR